MDAADLYVIKTPCELAAPGRWLRAALSLLDHINPFLVASRPADLEFDELDRIGQVAGFSAMRTAMEGGINLRRRAEWLARFHGLLWPVRLVVGPALAESEVLPGVVEVAIPESSPKKPAPSASVTTLRPTARQKEKR